MSGCGCRSASKPAGNCTCACHESHVLNSSAAVALGGHITEEECDTTPCHSGVHMLSNGICENCGKTFVTIDNETHVINKVTGTFHLRDEHGNQVDVPAAVVEDDPVHHPSHYGGPGAVHEVMKCLEAWGLDSDAQLWDAVIYIARARRKGNFLQDLRKARFWLDRRIQRLEEKENV